MKTQINGKCSDWDFSIYKLWQEKVMPRFSDEETCSMANFYTPRPYVDEYNRGSDRFGFTYIVEPGKRVCFVSWQSKG